MGGGGVRAPVPPLDPRMGPDYFYTYSDILKTHSIVHIGFCTTLCVLSVDLQVEREMRVLFEFRHFFFNSESLSTYFKVSCMSLQNN